METKNQVTKIRNEDEKWQFGEYLWDLCHTLLKALEMSRAIMKDSP